MPLLSKLKTATFSSQDYYIVDKTEGSRQAEAEDVMPNFKEFEVVMFTMNPSKSDTNWYLDSGVTTYVIRDLTKFTEMKHIVGINSVSFVVGQSHKAHGKGTVVAAHNEDIKLKNVLYVPGVKKNLISVRAIANMGYVVMFSPLSVGLCQKSILIE